LHLKFQFSALSERAGAIEKVPIPHPPSYRQYLPKFMHVHTPPHTGPRPVA